jgi:hypothetical protein
MLVYYYLHMNELFYDDDEEDDDLEYNYINKYKNIDRPLSDFYNTSSDEYEYYDDINAKYYQLKCKL